MYLLYELYANEKTRVTSPKIAYFSTSEMPFFNEISIFQNIVEKSHHPFILEKKSPPPFYSKKSFRPPDILRKKVTTSLLFRKKSSPPWMVPVRVPHKFWPVT